MHKVFVFGTLKQGFPNFSSNLGKRYASEFHTQDAYPLYLVGERYSPWLVLQSGNGSLIQGQVFEVDDQSLLKMDQLERTHEPDGYIRVSIQVVCLDTSATLAVFIYAKTPAMLANSNIRKTLDGVYTLEHANLYCGRNA